MHINFNAIFIYIYIYIVPLKWYLSIYIYIDKYLAEKNGGLCSWTRNRTEIKKVAGKK